MEEERFACSGISEDRLDNFEDYKGIIKNLLCCVCLDIVKTPMECSKCETLYCQICWEVLKMAGKPCVSKCGDTAIIKKANKFVREILEKLSFTCSRCNKTKIFYDEYIKHLNTCNVDPETPSRDQLINIVLEKEEKIDTLTKEIEGFKLSQITSMNKSELRVSMVSNVLNTSQKMELYNATIQGKTSEFKKFINEKSYPILEEVSAKNYYWTCLHYAMHYGKKDIIMFIFETLKKQNKLDTAVRLESNDGRCPFTCLLRSNTLSSENKRDIIDSILSKYNVFLSANVKKELKNRNLDYIIKRYNR